MDESTTLEVPKPVKAKKKKSGVKKPKFDFHSRESIEVSLKRIAQDPAVPGRDRVEALKTLLRIGGRLPAEELNAPEARTPTEEPEIRGSDLEPVKL